LPEATRYNGFSSAHNIAINEDTGFAYVVGADTCSGGLEMIDIGNPTAPAAAGCFDGHGYIHDTQCVIYNGPDADYLGRELCFSSASNRISSGPSRFLTTVSIVDVTDKLAPVEIANQSYGTGAGYSHQGWLTPDHAIFVHGDELDELFGAVETTTTRIWDISDLDATTLLAETTNGNTSIDHNIYIEGRYSFASNYTSGLRVIDIRDIADGSYEEVGFFDVYPENDNASFEGGTWSNYPFFSQKGLIAVSSIDRGLFLLQARIGRGDD
jgi:choice-of-anchor B domain-containing protein